MGYKGSNHQRRGGAALGAQGDVSGIISLCSGGALGTHRYLIAHLVQGGLDDFAEPLTLGKAFSGLRASPRFLYSLPDTQAPHDLEAPVTLLFAQSLFF